MSYNLLAQKAMLADIDVSMWTARRYDSEVSEETNRRNGAVEDAGRYNKLLVHKLDIQEVQRIRTAARQRHNMMTLPWMDSGSRLLASGLYMDYASEMRKFQAEYNAASDAFERNYPNILKRAKARLNGMFKEDDYPSLASIRSHFGFKVKIMPCPDKSDFRVDIAAEHLATIQQDVEDRMKNTLHEATRDIKERIVKVVGHMSEKLKAYKSEDGGRLFGSVVGNIQELVELLPAFNLTGDPNLTALIGAIKQDLCANSVEVLKENEDVRTSVAKAADKILTDVAAFMS